MFQNMRQLKVGQKYTIALFDYIGCPHHVQMTLKQLMCVDYQQWAEAYRLQYKKLDTRAFCQIVLHPGKQFVIWEGVHNPNTTLAVHEYMKDDGYGLVKMLKRWGHNDPRYLIRAKASVEVQPIAENINKPSNDPRLFNLCTVSG